ncbi:uncharacterized protein LOC131638843, partial [Vicia villosa]|uniref:uncharacterized protein LOC131638843 n=1 Tax=Vicia villosa TaxID=3911 RepID=UPI00273C901A
MSHYSSRGSCWGWGSSPCWGWGSSPAGATTGIPARAGVPSPGVLAGAGIPAGDSSRSSTILRTPLVEDVVVDRMIWQEEKNGDYSVKSGYRLWRRMQNNTRHYGIEEDEDEWHVFFGCFSTSQSWRATGLSSLIEPRLNTFHDAKSLILDVCSREDRRDAGRFAVLLETLWRSRNNVVWQDTREDAMWIGLQAYHNWYDWFIDREKHESTVTTNSSEGWVPPTVNQVKCNVDATFNKVCGSTNRGWCFRDHLGRFITGGVAWDVGSLSVIEAEATALKEAIQNAISLHLSHVIFESDCQIVTKSIHTTTVGSSEFSLIIRTQNLLLLFPNFEVKFIKRQANLVAHTLAKAANSWSRRSFFNM